MTFRPELLDELLKDYRNPADLMGEGGIFKQLTKALIERCLTAELDTHLEEEKAEPEAERPRNRRNGHFKKTIKGELLALKRSVLWGHCQRKYFVFFPVKFPGLIQHNCLQSSQSVRCLF